MKNQKIILAGCIGIGALVSACLVGAALLGMAAGGRAPSGGVLTGTNPIPPVTNAGGSRGQASGNTAPGNAGQGSQSQSEVPISFRQVGAQDASFTVQVPSDWQVQGASLKFFQATSARSETVSVTVLDVPSDPQSLQNYALVMQGVGQPLPPALQFYTPQLAPEDVIRILYPRVAGGAVQNVSLIEAQPVPMASDARAALVHYRYTRMGEISLPMEGAALVMTFPGAYNGRLNFWTLISFSGEGPAQLFATHKALYAAILGSIQYNRQVLGRQVRQPFDRMWQNDPNYRKQMDNLVTVMGGGVNVQDNSGSTGQVPIGSLPIGADKLWRCGANDYRLAPVQPGPACVEYHESH